MRFQNHICLLKRDNSHISYTVAVEMILSLFKKPSLYYVSIFWDFLDPDHLISINKVLNVNKNVHFLDPPSPSTDVI